MTNFEKYKNTIKSVAFGVVRGMPLPCSSISCGSCEFNGIVDCDCKKLDWLKGEYKEPKISIPDDTAINTKILVSGSGTDWLKRYYAGKMDGKHVVWNYGATSWTSEPDEISSWEYMKLYNAEDEEE